MRTNVYKQVARSLPLEPLPYELIESIARSYRLNPVVLFLVHNDLLLQKHFQKENQKEV